jgi:hypothetical protein
MRFFIAAEAVGKDPNLRAALAIETSVIDEQ